MRVRSAKCSAITELPGFSVLLISNVLEASAKPVEGLAFFWPHSPVTTRVADGRAHARGTKKASARARCDSTNSCCNRKLLWLHSCCLKALPSHHAFLCSCSHSRAPLQSTSCWYISLSEKSQRNRLLQISCKYKCKEAAQSTFFTWKSQLLTIIFYFLQGPIRARTRDPCYPNTVHETRIKVILGRVCNCALST